MAIVATRWSQAEAKFKQNVANGAVNSTDTSLGVGTNGPNGFDVAFPIQLSTSRFLWLMDDVAWPTASGQTRVQTLTSNGNGFLHNVVCLQVGADVSSATLTFHCSGNPAGYARAYFEARRPAVRYAMCGIRLDEVLLVMGMDHVSDPAAPAGSFPAGGWACVVSGDLDGANPDNWFVVEVPLRLPRMMGGQGWRPNWNFQNGIIDPGDGYIYTWLQGPWNQTGQWAVCRFDRAAAKKGDLTSPQWWNGRNWVYDGHNVDGPIRSRLNVAPTGNTADQPGAVFIRPDGQFQASFIAKPFNPPVSFAATQPKVQVAIRSTAAGSFGTPTDVYTIPAASGQDDTQFCYSAHMCPGQTWSGKATNDQLMNYSRNGGGNVLGDSRLYWPEFLKVTGL